MSRLFSAFWRGIYPILSQIGFSIIQIFPFKGNIGLWKRERRVFQQFKIAFPSHKDHHILLMCPSLGEYESVKAITTTLQKRNPNLFVEVIFFSPSGVNAVAGDNTELVDKVNYTPIDTTEKVEEFFHQRNVVGVIISTLAIWPVFLNYLSANQIPYGFVGVYVKNQFFKKLFIRTIAQYLQTAQYIFTIDDATRLKLARYSSNVIQIGDPRIASIEQDFDVKRNVVKVISTFKGKHKLLVLGSTHERDEVVIFPIIKALVKEDWKIIIAPHEIPRAGLLRNHLEHSEIYSAYSFDQEVSILIINTMGLLKYIYQLANVSYVGGGFSNRIHNILEPLIAHSPLIIGPKHDNSHTALSFRESNLIQVASSTNEFKKAMCYIGSAEFKNEESALWDSLSKKLKVNIEAVITTIEKSISL